MEPYLLRYFLAVVETGSFTKAAASSFITQPTLSAGIKRLEENLGVSLFVRNNKRVFLTSAGSRLVPHAKSILNECNMALKDMKGVIETPVIRLGVLQTLPSLKVAELLRGFRNHLPEVSFELIEGQESELLNRLEERTIDLAISLLRSRNETREAGSVFLYEEPYRFYLREDHLLAKGSEIDGHALNNEPMIVRSRCEVLSETSRYFTDRHVRPPLVYRTSHDERALHMVSAGLGGTLMPRAYSQAYDMKGVKALRLKDFNATRRIGIKWALSRLPQGLSRLCDSFCDFTLTAWGQSDEYGA